MYSIEKFILFINPEFCHEISDTQLPQVVPIVLPALLKVIVQDNLYSVRTRARAVRIFHTFAALVYSMCGRFPVSHMTPAILPLISL